jgi:hypothetical protein
LRNEGRLPDRASFVENSARQESGQPPLTYWVAAQFLRLLNLPMHTDDLPKILNPLRNLWFTPPDRWNRRDNLNLFFHGPREREGQVFGHPEVVLGNRAARLLSLVYGLAAVIGAYGASREVFQRESWAVTATAIFAFTPQMLAMSTYVNNDVSATAFATLAIWQTLRLLRCGATPRRLIVIGGLLALGGLSKVSTLLIAPGIGVAVIFDAWRRHLPLWLLLRNGLLMLVVICLILGPWVIYGIVTYNDPLGFGTHKSGVITALPAATIAQFLSAVPEVYLSYWGKLGPSAIWFHPTLYVLFSVIVVLAVVGYGLKIRPHSLTSARPSPLAPLPQDEGKASRGQQSLSLRIGEGEAGGESLKYSLPTQQTTVLLIILACVVAGFAIWLRDLYLIAYAVTGRLLFAAHIVIAIGLTGGLSLLAHRLKMGRTFPRILRGYTVGVLAGASVAVTPLSIYTAYKPPTLLRPNQLPKLQGHAIDYDGTIRVLGYTQATSIIRQGTMHQITLCWEVLKPTTRPTAAFALKLFSQDGRVVGERTSVHGLGHYPTPLWRAGDIFCDTLDIPVTEPLITGERYNALLVLLDANTLDVNWAAAAPDGTPIQHPFVAQVIGS